MARKIRFPLIMQNGAEVRTIEELRDHFDLETALNCFADGKLLTWLKDRYYDTEAENIEKLDKSAADFNARLCEILQVQCEDEASLEDAELRKERMEKLRKLTDDLEWIEKIDCIAFEQDDLLDMLDNKLKTIYLCQGEFTIPATVPDTTYIAIFGATAKLHPENADLSTVNSQLQQEKINDAEASETVIPDEKFDVREALNSLTEVEYVSFHTAISNSSVMAAEGMIPDNWDIDENLLVKIHNNLPIVKDLPFEKTKKLFESLGKIWLKTFGIFVLNYNDITDNYIDPYGKDFDKYVNNPIPREAL